MNKTISAIIILLITIPIHSFGEIRGSIENNAFKIWNNIQAAKNYTSVSNLFVQEKDFKTMIEIFYEKKYEKCSKAEIKKYRKKLKKGILKMKFEWNKAIQVIKKYNIKFSLRYINIKIESGKKTRSYAIEIFALEKFDTKLYLELAAKRIKGKSLIVLEFSRITIPKYRKKMPQ